MLKKNRDFKFSRLTEFTKKGIKNVCFNLEFEINFFFQRSMVCIVGCNVSKREKCFVYLVMLL